MEMSKGEFVVITGWGGIRSQKLFSGTYMWVGQYNISPSRLDLLMNLQSQTLS